MQFRPDWSEGRAIRPTRISSFTRYGEQGNNTSGQQSQGGNWDKINTVIGTSSLAFGMKETIIEGGAALNRGINISKVNNISLLRTYGATGAKYLKLFKTFGVAGSIVTTGYSASKVYDQAESGGVNEILKHRDILDAGVGGVGLGAVGLAYFGIISNPVGWGIGAGILIYGGVTLVYDATMSKP